MRCPDHPLARELIATSDRPLAAPSANRFGEGLTVGVGTFQTTEITAVDLGFEPITTHTAAAFGLLRVTALLTDDGIDFVDHGGLAGAELSEETAKVIYPNLRNLGKRPRGIRLR